MNKKSLKYRETYPLQLNVYLLFYIYVFLILIIANTLPVWPSNYFLFLFFGITAIALLFVKFTYSILINGNIIELSLNIPFKIILVKLKISDIETIEQVKTEVFTRILPGMKRSNIYFFNKGGGLRFTMYSGKIIIISGVNAKEVISLLNKYQIVNIQPG